MRTIAQSIALIRRQLESNERHLQQHSSRKDLVEGSRLALKELAHLQDQVLGYQACLQSQEKKILKMRKTWNDQLLKIHLFLCNNGFPPPDLLRVIDQPMDLLIMPYEAALKSEVVVDSLDPKKYTVQENLAILEKIQNQYVQIEQQIQSDLMTMQYQLDKIITKYINQ